MENMTKVLWLQTFAPQINSKELEHESTWALQLNKPSCNICNRWYCQQATNQDFFVLPKLENQDAFIYLSGAIWDQQWEHFL